MIRSLKREEKIGEEWRRDGGMEGEIYCRKRGRRRLSDDDLRAWFSDGGLTTVIVGVEV